MTIKKLTQKQKLEMLKERIASCKKLRQNTDGSIALADGTPIFKAEPATHGPNIIIINKEPTWSHSRKKYCLKDSFDELTSEELAYVQDDKFRYDCWAQREAEFYAADSGGLYHHEGYVLGDLKDNIFGRGREVDIEGKLAVAVQYYNFVKCK